MYLSLSGFISHSVISPRFIYEGFSSSESQSVGISQAHRIFHCVCRHTSTHWPHFLDPLIHQRTHQGLTAEAFFSGFEAGARPPCLQAPRGTGDSEARRGCLLLQLARWVGSKPTQPSVVSRLARLLLGIVSGEVHFRTAANHFSD